MVSSISRNSTFGVSPSNSAACSDLYFDVMKARAPQSLTMYDQLFGGEPRRGGGVDQPGVLASPQDLEIAGVVLEAQGDVIAWLQSRCPEQLAEPVGPGVEFAERERCAGLGGDDGGLVGVLFEV